MRMIELNELKNIELDMVKYLDQICTENNLSYFLVGGTLLGAIRHKGFIPWDDDIDIAMPRKDFEKLFALQQSMGDSHYKIAFYNNTKDYGYSFPKMIDTRTILIDQKLGYGKEKTGVFIDIFLYDGVGNSKYFAYIYYCIVKIIKKMVFLSKRRFIMESFFKTVIFAIPWTICKVIGVNRINSLFNKVAAKKDFYDNTYVACISGRYGMREIFHRSVFASTQRVSFEDTRLQIPVGYVQYLSALYGDYMKLPPIEKRTSNHTSIVYWNDAQG